jgi:hypothetical protein
MPVSLKETGKRRKWSRVQLYTSKNTISQHLPGRNKIIQRNPRDHDPNETFPQQVFGFEVITAVGIETVVL